MIPTLLLPTHATRLIVYPKPVNMQLGYDGLRKLCEGLGVDASRGTVVLFTNRDQSALKLYWQTSTGDEILYRKLFKGAFLMPLPQPGKPYAVLRPNRLQSLLRA